MVIQPVLWFQFSTNARATQQTVPRGWDLELGKQQGQAQPFALSRGGLFYFYLGAQRVMGLHRLLPC
jgi:hypothetical protein